MGDKPTVIRFQTGYMDPESAQGLGERLLQWSIFFVQGEQGQCVRPRRSRCLFTQKVMTDLRQAFFGGADR